jgi:hypothetical protein
MKTIKTSKQFRDYAREKLEAELRGNIDDEGFYSGPEEVDIQLCEPDMSIVLGAIKMRQVSINVRKKNKHLPCIAHLINAEISSTFLITFQITPSQRFADIVEDEK